MPAKPLAASVAYPTLKESWGALGWLLLISLLLGLVALALVGWRTGTYGLGRLAGLTLASELSIVVTIWWVRRRAGPRRWSGLALWGPQERWQLYALLPAIVLAQATLLSVVALLHLPSPNDKIYHEIARYPALLLGFGCFAAPVLEELFFRGILLKGLLRNYRPAVAIGQSALLFGVMHMSPAQSIATALMGIVLGWLYYRTRSVGLCIGLHMLNNLLAFSSMRHPKLAGSQDMLDFFSPGYYVGLLVVAAATLGSVAWWMQRTLPPVPLPGPEAGDDIPREQVLPSY
ncbi:CPBP family intramembrane glutamic endopeptidase [Hymenobacter bucti]|uniref:CPBP family intramembrane glutamic endopeptidase n=1 Tax=Hymenobacter bucti TaxID=1844114 RepID=UPI0036D3D5F3